MKFKKLLIVISFLFILVTLTGCNNDYKVTLNSNNENAVLNIEEGNIIDGVRSFIISTNEIYGYKFDYWYIEADDVIVSTDLVYNYKPTKNVTITAMYSEYNIEVNVDSNIESIEVTIDDFPTNSGATQYEVTAPSNDDYLFLYWLNIDTELIVSFDNTYSFVPEESINLEAFYIELIESEATLGYSTEFEDATKDAYATAVVSLSGENFTFNDALIGSLATDLNISGKSVRIRNGYIQSEFSISNISQISFYAGNYGSDTDTTVNFYISTDKLDWILIDSFTSSTDFVQYVYIFDESFINTHSLNIADAYYIKIESELTNRTNIDNLEIYTGSAPVNSNPLYEISFEDSFKSQYFVGEEINLDGCIATHEDDSTTTCNVLGSVDNTTVGDYELIFYKIDELGRVATFTKTIKIMEYTNVDLSMDLDSYYDDAEGLYGPALEEALHDIINNGFVGVTYGEARYILDETDMDPNNSNNLILVYLGVSVPSVWDLGVTWNREHIWPQSLLGEAADNGTVNMASDLYNLMPANPAENTLRGNDPYSDLGMGYEPRDEVKGDIARALFYMMIMYDELELVNDYPGLHEMGFLDTLLEWHYSDPVDDFEINRMEVIYSYQLNRNPFVDYPHLVDLIWFYNN